MKFILALSALVAAVAAQDINSLPDCGKLCVNNMLGQASSLGCSSSDVKCLCSNANFGNGLRDCSGQACGAAVQAQVVSYGQAYCAGVAAQGSGATTTGGGSGTTTGGAGATATSAASSASSSANSAASSASSAISSAASSASNAVSSVASSANSAASSAASRASGGASSAASSAASSGFARPTQAPVAAAGLLGLAVLLI